MREPRIAAPLAALASHGYHAEVLTGVRPGAGGLLHVTPGGEHLLRWSSVGFAAAAEVGEPEGVRTIVFDLVLGRGDGGWRVARFDADPGPPAEELARAIFAGVEPRRRGASIKSLALDGVASQWHPDLESFEEAVLAAIPRGAG